MKKLNKTYLDNLVTKLLNETLEEKADKLVSKIKGDVKETEVGFEDLTDEEIDNIMNQTGDTEDEIEPLSESNVCEQCGGEMSEGECMECGYMNESIYHREEDEMPEPMETEEDIYDVAKQFGNKRQSFDYVEQDMNEESDEDMENKEFCKYQLEKFGPDDERFKEKCGSLMESLVGNQKKLDKNKNNKIDSEDFKLLRKSKKHKKETDEEVEEGNAFTGALAKAKKEGKDEFEVGGKKFQVNEKGKSTIKESFQLTENELIDLIEKIVKEEKAGMKTLGKPKGLTKYEQVHKADGKENDEYLKMVTKKMKDYLKDGSKGDYEVSPKHFPKGNGELATMKKKAYIPSGAVQDYTDNFTAAALENLDYDEIHPDENWVSDNVEGSSRTGNNPEWANAVETDVNKKRNKIRKDNLLSKLKRKAYNKAPQPAVIDKSGENEGDKIMAKLESIKPKEKNKINEEFDKIKSLISYDRKTQ